MGIEEDCEEVRDYVECGDCHQYLDLCTCYELSPDYVECGNCHENQNICNCAYENPICPRCNICTYSLVMDGCCDCEQVGQEKGD